MYEQQQEKQKEEAETGAASVSSSSTIAVRSTPLTNSIQQNQEEEDALECLELPPPMKPISKIDDNCIQSSNPSGSKAHDENDLAEIEQIVKEKMVSC